MENMNTYPYTEPSEFWKIVKDAILSENSLNDIIKVIDDNIESCDTDFKDIWNRASEIQKFGMVEHMFTSYMNSIYENYCELKVRRY